MDDERDYFADYIRLSAPAKESARVSIGKPGELIAQSVNRTVALVSHYPDELAALIEASGTHTEAEQRVKAWGETKVDEQVSAQIFRATTQGNLAGQLFVRGIEAPGATKRLSKIGVSFEESGPFLRMDFAAALEYFLQRTGNDESVYELLDAYRRQGDAAQRELARVLASRCQELLARHLREGGDLRGFASELRAGAVELGIEAPKPSYINTVYRTQIQTAYGAGRYKQMTSPEVMATRPYVEYRTVGDGAVRPEHAALDGKQWRIDDPEWHRWMTPNGFNCRCQIITLDAEDASDSALSKEVTGSPDEGFEGPPQA